MKYNPKQGDIIWVDLDSQAGHEQAGRRPCLIVWGNDTLDRIPGLSQVCPISNRDNGYPLHVPLGEGSNNTTGFVLCEQPKVLDLDARNAVFKDQVSDDVLHEVIDILHSTLD